MGRPVARSPREIRPGRARWVYGRHGKPCLRCATPLRYMSQSGYGGERVTFWCPRCQPSTTPRRVSSPDPAGRSLSANNWKE
ncbi:MAG: zinc finger domain-containing protein [Actinomycetota bacterium]